MTKVEPISVLRPLTLRTERPRFHHVMLAAGDVTSYKQYIFNMYILLIGRDVTRGKQNIIGRDVTCGKHHVMKSSPSSSSSAPFCA